MTAKRRASPSSSFATLFLFVLAMSGTANAAPPDKDKDRDKDTRDACAQSYERAQRLRQAHDLKGARAELLVCARAECPNWVRHDCVPWLGDVDATMPTLMIIARDSNGAPQSNVRVTIDGALVTDHLGADPIPLNPGEHTIIVDAVGVARIEQHLTLHEGERDRRLELTLVQQASPPPTAPSTATTTAPLPPPPPLPIVTSQERPVPAIVYILAGTGIAFGSAGAFFQIDGMGQRSDLFKCAPRCSQDDVDSARRSTWVGNILLGASAITIAAAVWFFFTRPSSGTSDAASSSSSSSSSSSRLSQRSYSSN